MSTEKPLPSHASVVVIGGGIMGCSTLYHLAEFGLTDAVLLERNQLTSGTTWHSAAQVRALRSSRNLTEMIRYSISLYSRLEAETGQSTGWVNTGSLSIATNPDRLTHVRRQEALAHAYGVAAHSISGGEAKERWPLMNADDVVGAVWSPEDGRVNPSDLCAALVKGARSRGATIFEDTSVTGILTKDGAVTGVETERGTITCDAVALCTGLWSRRCAGLAGVSAPVFPCEHFYLLTKPIAGAEHHLPSLSDHDGHLYIRDEVGGLLVGCFEPGGKPLDPDSLGEDFAFGLLSEDWDHFEPMMINALHRIPALETAEAKMLLNGPESFTPDGSFMLGQSAETSRFFLGCGMNSVGVASGGGAGMALAHLIAKGRPIFDLHEADPTRFHPTQNSVEALTARAPEVLGRHYEITYPGRQFSSARDLRELPVQNQWRKAQAHFGQVYGYERPLYFGKTEEPELTFGKPAWFKQVGDEVAAASTKVGLFDQSTFGKLRVEGRDAPAFLDRLCANNMQRSPRRAIYTAMLNEQGGFESDLTALRLREHLFRLYVGTASVTRDMAWLRRHIAPGEDVSITDETEEFAVFGIQGPGVSTVVSSLGAPQLNDLKYFCHTRATLAGAIVLAVRMSYVGELGFELTCRTEDAEHICDALLGAGATPCGLFAQTSMRIEKRFLSFGHDIDSDVSPLEAGLDFAVNWSGDFIGKRSLEERKAKGIQSTMVSFKLDDANAWPIGNEPIWFNDTIVGQTTSGTYGYRVGAPVALGYVQLDAFEELHDARVKVDIARALFDASVSVRPLFDPAGSRMRSGN